MSEVDNYFAGNQEATDARDQIKELLAEFGLTGLENFVTNGIMSGWTATQTAQELRKTPEYQQRFDAIIQRQKLGLPALSETDVLNLERSYAQNYAAAGMPVGFYDDPDDFKELIVKDIAPTEHQSRLQDGFLDWANADPFVKDALRQQGVSDAEGAMFFLDPDRAWSVIQKQYTTAKIQGAGQRTGFGAVDQTAADNLFGQGITADQAQSGFNELASQRELMSNLPGEQGDAITQEEQLAAEFGKNADAQKKIKDRAASRVGAFQNGSQYSSNKEGYGGLGSAR